MFFEPAYEKLYKFDEVYVWLFINKNWFWM